MTNPFDTESFSTKETSVPTEAADSGSTFTLRTMQDDLAALTVKDLPAATKTIEPIVPTPKPPVAPIEKQPAKTFNPAEIKSEQVSAIREKPVVATQTKPTPSPAAKPTIVQTATPAAAQKPLPIASKPKVLAHKNPKPLSVKVLSSIATVLFISIIGLSAYYYQLNKKNQSDNIASTDSGTENISNDDSSIINVPTEEFSTTKPNYLSLDISSPEAAKQNIIDLSHKLPNNPGAIYEFIAVDANNDPVPFSVYAKTLKLKFSPTIQKSLGETFSLFFYNDNGEIKQALSVAFLGRKDLLVKELAKQEKTLPTNLTALFLETTPEIKTGKFNSSTYNNFAVRYLNLNAALTLSIDYTLSDTNLFIGTTKNTLRATLDKITQTPVVETVPTQEAPETTDAPQQVAPELTEPSPVSPATTDETLSTTPAANDLTTLENQNN